MRFLTFNHHESFLQSLAKTGDNFDVVVKYKKHDLSWNVSCEKPDTNIRLIEFDGETQKKLKDGYYDAVICHTLMSLIWMWPYSRNHFIFIAHIPLFFSTFYLSFKSFVKKSVFRLFAWTHRTSFVSVSDLKRASWKEKGFVIPLAPAELPRKNPEDCHQKVVFVCNHLLERKEELGWETLECLTKKVPMMIIGQNPGVPDHVAYQPNNYRDFVEAFSGGSLYVYAVPYPIGDGYNTAMLEAMYLGMPVVTIENKSSPIEHQKNGLVAKNIEEMKEWVQYLLSHPEERQRLGRNAHMTVVEKFSIEVFKQKWQHIFTLIKSEKRYPQEVVDSAL